MTPGAMFAVINTWKWSDIEFSLIVDVTIVTYKKYYWMYPRVNPRTNKITYSMSFGTKLSNIMKNLCILGLEEDLEWYVVHANVEKLWRELTP